MTTSENYDSYIPIFDALPDKWEESKEFLVEQLKQISNAVNSREIGFFLNEELLSGKQFYPGTNVPQQFRTVFRTVVPFGALPNNATKSVAHNVIVDANFSLIDMWIAATDPIGLTGFSVQYYSIGAADIKLSYTSTNVVLTTTSNYSNFTTSYVILEYIKEI